jgi:hypothetical protein
MYYQTFELLVERCWNSIHKYGTTLRYCGGYRAAAPFILEGPVVQAVSLQGHQYAAGG